MGGELIFLGLALFCVLGGLFGAESRPDWLDPRVRHQSGRMTTK